MTGRLEELEKSVAERLHSAGRLLILTHNDPDPDAIAGALALRTLMAARFGLESPIVYRGMVGRAENKALVRYLRRPLRLLKAADLRDDVPIALIDTQPGAGNNALPPDRPVILVVDHHPLRPESASAAFSDVRPDVGATSTLVAGYLQEAGVALDPPLATALFYGIKTDTLGLLRNASQEDVDTYFRLQPQIDVEALAEIERAQVPPAYFHGLDAALHATRVYGDLALAYIGPMQRPDMAAEMADLLLRLKGVRWSVCLGAFKGDLILSARTRRPQGGAGVLVQSVMGDGGTAGGHSMMAAAQMPLHGQDPDQAAQRIVDQVLQALNVPGEDRGIALLQDRNSDADAL